MPARRKLDPIAVEQIVTLRGAGRSYRQIGASLGVSHSTVSRLVASDPILRVRIRRAQKREARRARERERKARAQARREAAIQPGSPPAQGQRSLARPSPDGQHEPGEQAPQVAEEAARPRAGDSKPNPGRVPRGGQGRVSSTRPHGRRDELRLARRILLDRSASFEAREMALERLVELLDATRSNGRPAHSLQLAAAAAIVRNPDYTDQFATPTRSSARRRRRW